MTTRPAEGAALIEQARELDAYFRHYQSERRKLAQKLGWSWPREDSQMVIRGDRVAAIRGLIALVLRGLTVAENADTAALATALRETEALLLAHHAEGEQIGTGCPVCAPQADIFARNARLVHSIEPTGGEG